MHWLILFLPAFSRITALILRPSTSLKLPVMKFTILVAVSLLPLCLLAQEEPPSEVQDGSTIQEEMEAEEAEAEAEEAMEAVTVAGEAVRDTIWLTALSFGLNFNQAAFSDNWVGGGINSIAFSSFFNYSAHYDKAGWSWDSEIDMLYGVISSRNQGSRKSQDRIFLDSKVGRELSQHWNGYFSLSFLTQFAPGYRYEENAQGVEEELLVSRFMSPGFLTASLGFEYDPSDNFTLRLSPLSSRLTFVADTSVLANVEARDGLEFGDQVRRELYALQIQADYSRYLTENINLKTRYLLFANYDNFGPKDWDHRLELLFSAKLTRFINVSLNTIFLYDSDQAEDPQVSQSLGVGILFQRERAR